LYFKNGHAQLAGVVYGKLQWPGLHKKTTCDDALNPLKQIPYSGHLPDFPCIEVMGGIELGSMYFVKRALIPCRIANGCKHSNQHGAIRNERRIIAFGTRDCTRRVKCKPAHFHAKAQPGANALFIVDEWRKRPHTLNNDGVLHSITT
jgi:hypothetical protein